MKRILITLCLLLFTGSMAQAQGGFLNKVIKSAQSAAENAVESTVSSRVDRAVTHSVNKAEDKVEGRIRNNAEENEAARARKDAEAAEQRNAPATEANANLEFDDWDMEEEDVAMMNGPAAGAQQQGGAKALELTYAKSDFVAGDEVFFSDDQANEQLGEFPSQWDMEDGNAEIVQFGEDKCIMLIGYTTIMPLIGDGKNYLPDQFTIEFDIYPRYTDTDDKASPSYEIGFNDDRTLIARFYNVYSEGASLDASWRKPNDEEGNITTIDNNVFFAYDQWHHVALSFNKRAMKLYVDGTRVVNIPNMKQPTSMWIWSEKNEALFKNFRIAKGAVPLYDRMMSDGKFITYGITFDVGKSTIKPESMGEINRIVTLMTDNPDLKFSVEGHTDNTGNAASNQTLSEARSKAIVDKLVEMGIAAGRLSSSGKGQNSPIADNGTDEGRAKNRRVEFVKK